MRNVQEGCMGQLNRILLSVATFREEIIKDNKICSNRMSWQKLKKKHLKINVECISLQDPRGFLKVAILASISIFPFTNLRTYMFCLINEAYLFCTNLNGVLDHYC